MDAPGDAIRKIADDIDPAWPGALFRIEMLKKTADMADLYWASTAANSKFDDAEDRHLDVCMSMARIIGFLIRGTLAHFGDNDAKSDTAVALAVIVSMCEDTFGEDMIPQRPVVNAVSAYDDEDDCDDASPT